MIKQIIDMAKNMMNPYDGSDRNDHLLAERIKNEDEATDLFTDALKTYECEFHPSVDENTGSVMVNIVSIHKNKKDEQDCTQYIYEIQANYRVTFVAIFNREGKAQIFFKSTW